MFNKLALPKPSERLIALIRDLAKNKQVNASTLFWHEQRQPAGVNCAFGVFFTDPALAEVVCMEYQHLFNVKMIPIIGLIKNTKDESASYPPHTDRIRHVALNFYIEAGGTDVRTIFYDKTDLDDDKIGGNVLSYNNLPPITDVLTFEANYWYILPTRQYHSVENIETTRIILSLTYVGDVEKFIMEHEHLIVDNLVDPEGFEPPTFCFEDRHSIQLN